MERNLLVIIKEYFLSEQDRLMAKDDRYMDGLDRSNPHILDGNLSDTKEATLIYTETRGRRAPAR